MIRSSALLTVIAMAVLVAGVSAANLGLIYLSIAVSILAAVTLAVGVLLRRRELFGKAEAAPRSAQPGWATAETANAIPVPVRPAGDRVPADRAGRREDNRRDGEQQGDPAARQRKAASGSATGAGSARWPASIAAKGVPAGAGRDGEHLAGRGGHLAGRGRAARSPMPTGSTERGAGWPPRPGRDAGAGRPGEPGRDRVGTGRGRESGKARESGRAQETPASRDRDQAGRERDKAAAGQQAEAFRLPSQSERTRARAEELGRAISGNQAGDDFWDRVSEELTGSGGQGPARPAWPATAGPRAMGTGSARRAPGKTGDEPEEAEPGASRQSERAARDRDAIPAPPDDEHDREEQPAGPGAEPRWDRVVPPYVDDRASRGGQQREPEPQPAGADEPDDDAARAGAPAGPAASSAWSAWSIEAGAHEAGAGTSGEDAAAEMADHAEPGEEAKPAPGGEAPSRAERPDGADGPGETADRSAEAQGAAEPGGTPDAADPGNTPGADDAGDSGESDGGADGSTSLDDEVAVVPGVPRYHRRGCILIRFLSDGDLETTTRREAEAAGSVPCKACQPDEPAGAD